MSMLSPRPGSATRKGSAARRISSLLGYFITSISSLMADRKQSLSMDPSSLGEETARAEFIARAVIVKSNPLRVKYYQPVVLNPGQQAMLVEVD